MPRAISTQLRRSLEEPRSNEYLVILLQIDHPTLNAPIRVANDVVAYAFGGDTYIGFPFEFELIDDSTQVPKGRVRIQNVDRVIGEAIRELTSPPFVTITFVASSDFKDSLVNGERHPFDNGGPHHLLLSDGTELLLTDGTQILLEDFLVFAPVVEYQATNLMFGSIAVDASAITAELSSFDITREPWPAVRATADRLPGLDP